MIGPRWRKVIRDVFGRPGRSLLAVLALSAGVFEIGAMLYKYALLQPELTTMYERTRPASAVLLTDSVDDSLIEVVSRVAGVAAAEARPVVMTRVRVGPDEWMPAAFTVVRDFDNQKMDTFQPEDGAWPPGDDEVLLERSALRVAQVGVSDNLTVKLAGGGERTIKVAGTVHAAGLAPAWMEHMVPGFITWNSPLRGADESAQIRIIVDHPLDEGYIHEVADSVKAVLEARGHAVTRITVPAPGRHPHADQMEAFLFLVLAFGILSFALSVVLVASLISGLMTEQVRQVGIMKAIGATSGQVAGIYLGQVALLALGALIIGIPLGLLVGRAYAQFAAGILNANITHRPFPVWLVLAEIVVGLLVPLLAALAPVRRAARITVHQALNGDFAPRAFGTRGLDRWLARAAWVPRPLALSVRTTFLRRGRLLLTVLTLAMGGAVFISALNVSAAWNRSVDADFRVRRYDVTMSLAEPTPIETVETLLAGVPGVERAEYWPGASPYLVGANGVPGGTVAIVGPGAASKLLELPLLSGRWLRPEDTDGAVINQATVVRNPALKVGGNVEVRFPGRTVSLPIVGIVKELAPMPVIYTSPEVVLAGSGRPAGMARTVRIVTLEHSDAAQRDAARSLEQTFAGAGVEVSGMQRMLDVKKSILDHLVIIMTILTMASLIVVFVGAIALTSTVTLSVLQRTREIGVLGAIGATPRTIAGHVWFESVLIGVLSWGAAVLLAAPISYALEAACGSIFFKVPLDFYFSPGAAGIWLGLVVVLASFGSVYPARRATRLTVREALAYV